MSSDFNVEYALEILNHESNESGPFSVIDKGFEILPNEYHDFWKWLFDDREFFEHNDLSRIGGYVLSEEMQNNKNRLYEYVRNSAIGAAWELPELIFYKEAPLRSYEECRKEVAIVVEQKQAEIWKHLFDWSKGFHKFVCKPTSEKFLRTRCKKELKMFLRSIDYQILVKAFVLYSHEARIKILNCYSDRIKLEVLEKMRTYSKAGTLYLTECVKAESIINRYIGRFWQLEIGENLEEYMQEQKKIVDKVRKETGEMNFYIPYNLSVKRCLDGIVIKIKPMNVDYYQMTHVYDIDWKYPIIKYAFILYKYVLGGQGKVYIDIEGRRTLPVYNFESCSKHKDYFLFLYRLMKLEKCFTWIVLSDIIKKTVRNFEQDLIIMKERENFFIRLSGNQPFRTPIRELNYHEKILEGIWIGGSVTDVLKNVVDTKCICEEIKREFPVNLYLGDCKYKNQCCDVDAIDFWVVQNDRFYGLNLYWNSYDSMIEKIFFYANYLGDLLKDGLFENLERTNDVMRDVKNVGLIVLMTEQQDNVFFREWVIFSEKVVEKVKILWRNV